MKKKVLILDAIHPVLEERLSNLGYVCQQDYTSSKTEVEQKINNYFGIVIRSRFPIDQTFIDKAPNLKFIARSGAGLENIDTDYAEKKGIKIFNSPEGNKDAVAEHIIGMLLMLFNQLKKGDAEVKSGKWDREGNRGLEIAGKTIGIIGYGNMGSAFAKKLSGFDCHVISYDKYKSNYSDKYIKEVSLNTLFNEADIISIHLPLTTETHHYVNHQFISQFKKDIYLINTARGNNVNLNDLIKNLKNGKVLGTCLDVLELETKSFEITDTNNLSESFIQLTQSNKVVLSPHVAGWTIESYQKLSSFLADKIEKEFS